MPVAVGLSPAAGFRFGCSDCGAKVVVGDNSLGALMRWETNWCSLLRPLTTVTVPASAAGRRGRVAGRWNMRPSSAR